MASANDDLEPVAVRIVGDFEAVLSECGVSLFDFALAPREFLDAFCHAIDAGEQLVALTESCDAGAGSACEVRVLMHPTAFLRRVATAVAARNFDLGIFGASRADHVQPREDLCAFDAHAMNVIEGRAKP